MYCWILEVCPVPRAIVCLPGTGVDCTLLKQMRSGQRHSGSTMPYNAWSPCAIAALPSTVLTGGQGSFQNPVSPSWNSSQCQPPRHSKLCHMHSCGRTFLVVAFGALAAHTWHGAIVGNETSHVDGLAVDGEVPHAADELPVVHREILRQVWDTTKEERAS